MSSSAAYFCTYLLILHPLVTDLLHYIETCIKQVVLECATQTVGVRFKYIVKNHSCYHLFLMFGSYAEWEVQ